MTVKAAHVTCFLEDADVQQSFLIFKLKLLTDDARPIAIAYPSDSCDPKRC